MCDKSLQSYPTLCNLIDFSPPGSSVHGILQARILVWVSMPPPGTLPGPGIKFGPFMSPALAGKLCVCFSSVRHFIMYTLQGILVSAFDILGGWGSNRSNSFYPDEPGSNLNPGLHGSKAHSPFAAFQNLSWVGETCQQESKQGFEESH